jgi:phage protein D
VATAQKLYDLGESFYVPEFIVKVAGRELPDPVVRDVLEVRYKDDIEEIDAFELKLSNWDEEKFRFKYEPPSRSEFEGLFDPGARFELWMGYQGSPRLMLTGEVTTLETSYASSGAATLMVRGLNVLHSFRTEQHTMAWENERDSDIAEDLGRRPRAKGRAGLGIEVRTAPLDSEPEEPYVLMDNQYDIVFLLARSRRHGYDVVLKEEDDGEGRRVQYLYFGPSESRSEPPPTYRFEWGKTLSAFRPTLSTAQQISEVIVRGWDRRRNKKIEGKATWQDLVPDGPERRRMGPLAQAFGGRREVITDQPVHTEAQAKALAKEILSKKLKHMVQATGTSVGLPELRAGRKLEVAGLGVRFDGTYFVKSTEHTLGNDGYRTEFTARREGALGS